MQRIFSFLFFGFLSLIALAGFFDKKSEFLKASDAFQLTFSQKNQRVELHWDIANGYWLYQKSIEITVKNAVLGQWHFPSAEDHLDPYFGQTKIFQKQLDLSFPLEKVAKGAEISVTFQGCTDGLCYPPETQTFPLMPQIEENGENTHHLASTLFYNKYAIFGFFLLGVGLAFTPCVLPMLPLLSALVIGRQQRVNTYHALALSFTYVQGMALTYVLLGLCVVMIGLPFQVALQSPIVLVGLSVIFALLACSMFGLFTIQLPLKWQNALLAISQNQKSGAFGGVFVMGAVAGLVASPCTSAPLSGVLLYVAQSGDILTGGVTLYVLAMGMGLPLMLLTVFGNQILPKSGEWLNGVKTAFGFILLALPIFLLSRITGEVWENRLWALLGSSFFLWLALILKPNKGTWVVKIFAFILAFTCVQPLQTWLWQGNEKQAPITTTQMSHLWKKVSTLTELKQDLANNPKAFAVVDFYADWCVACKELEKYTFSHQAVQEKLKDALLLKIDVTENTPENTRILKDFAILGLPAVLFFDQNGEEISSDRISGFLNAQAFLQKWNRIHHLTEK